MSKKKPKVTTLACPSGPGRLEAAINKEVAKLSVLDEGDGINVRIPVSDIFVDYKLGDEDHSSIRIVRSR